MNASVRRYDSTEPQVREVYRRDNVGELLKATIQGDGSILAEGVFAKPGVLIYFHEDGTERRELLLPEELHRPDSLRTMGRKSVVNEHPVEGGRLVDVGPSNVGRFGVGDVAGDVTILKDTGFVKVQVAVRRRDAVEGVKAERLVELSPGYKCKVEEIPGEHEVYGRYDAIQRDRIYNHLALTQTARGGAECRIRLDSDLQVLGDEDRGDKQATGAADAKSRRRRQQHLVDIQETLGDSPMTTKTDTAEEARYDSFTRIEDKAKSIDREFDRELARMTVENYDSASARTLYRAARDELDVALKDGLKATAKADKLQEKLDQFELKEKEEKDAKEKKDAPEAKAKAKGDALKAELSFFDERTEILEVAGRFDGFDADAAKGLGNADLKEAVVKQHMGEDFPKEPADGFVDAAFIMASKVDSADRREEPADDKPRDPMSSLFTTSFRRDQDDRRRDARDEDDRRGDGKPKGDPADAFFDSARKQMDRRHGM